MRHLPSFYWVEDDGIEDEPLSRVVEPRALAGMGPGISTSPPSSPLLAASSDLGCLSHDCITGRIPGTAQAHPTASVPHTSPHPPTHQAMLTHDTPTKQETVVLTTDHDAPLSPGS